MPKVGSRAMMHVIRYRVSHQRTFRANRTLADFIVQMASNKSCSPAQISLAWLLAQGDNIVPIPGTNKVKHLEDNFAAADIDLTSEDLL